jgi:hypothetical protein
VLLLTLVFTILGFLAMGYHPGAEDDGVYLSAVKTDLHPQLFPHDSDFFRLQLQATVFDSWMAKFADTTHLSIAWSELLWQLFSLFLILLACRDIAARLFAERRAQWGAVALVSAMFTLPVAGTALYLVDQYLHPRAISTALILFAVSRILAGKWWQSVPLIILAVAMHPLMGILGLSFCFFLFITGLPRLPAIGTNLAAFSASLIPLGWLFEPPSPEWHQALNTRSYYFLSRWEWYEWLGAIAPLFIFWLLWRLAQRRKELLLARFSLSILLYGCFQFLAALAALEIPVLVRLTPMQPMRFLHLIYFFLCLIGGAYLGKLLLKNSAWRWIVFLFITNGSMFLVQRDLFASSPHLELPETVSNNPWLEAFSWIRRNTPTSAYFTLDPDYMSAPSENFHSFRALAERSELTDAFKDAAVATQVPRLAVIWHQQQIATRGWKHFQLTDFERLKSQFGVDWALVYYPAPSGLGCKWHNSILAVCQIP